MKRLVNILTCLLLLAAVAVRREGRLLGWDVAGGDGDNGEPTTAVIRLADGATVIDTSLLPEKFFGYGGPVPVRATFRDGRVESVEPVLPNSETPIFFGMLEEAGFWTRWNGLAASEAANCEADAVTGATYSSNAAIGAIRAAASEFVARHGGDSGAGAGIPARSGRPCAAAIAAALYLAVLLVAPGCARTRPARRAMLAANVAVLGIWTGMFVSTGRLAGWMASGLAMRGWELASAAFLLTMVFAYPLLGRPGYYCANVCPFGSAQELVGALSRKKCQLPPRLVRFLTLFRDMVWGGLMCSIWLGVWSGWLGWELFAAFAWRSAPAALLALAAATLAVSIAVPRPYCRFICPTGTLIRM